VIGKIVSKATHKQLHRCEVTEVFLSRAPSYKYYITIINKAILSLFIIRAGKFTRFAIASRNHHKKNLELPVSRNVWTN